MTPRPRRSPPGARPARGPAPARDPGPGAGSGWAYAAGLLFLLALAWRIGFLSRLSASVFGGSLIEDAHSYWVWSGFLRTHGALGTNAFFLGPLYPYLLAGLRALVGDSVPHVLLVQAVWGSLAVVLVADAARRLTSARIGLAVGVIAAFYEMAVFFDGQVLMESLLYFLECLLLWQVVRTDWRAPRARAVAWLGVIVGLLAEGRATAALLLIPLAWLAGGAGAGGGRARARALGAVLAGFVLVTAPVALRNRVVTGEWIPFTYNFGYNLYMGNNPEATGGSVPIAGTSQPSPVDPSRADGGQELDGREYLRVTTGRSLGPQASSDYWAGRAAEYARAHPVRVAGLTLRRLVMLWNRREYPQIENVDEFRAVAGPVGLPFVGSFALLGPLALAGLWFAWARSGRAGRFLCGYAAVVTLGVVPFFVTDRYRHHLVPALLLLAAIAVRTIVAAWRAGPAALRARCGAAVLAGLIVTWLPAPGLSRGRLAWEIDSDIAMGLAGRGDYAGAVSRFEKAVRIERAERRPGRTTGSALERAQLFAGYGVALQQLGRLREAVPQLERARTLAPEDASIAAALAGAYARAGRGADADSVRGRLPALVGGEGRALTSRGWDAAQAGRFAEAESLFARAVAVDPGLSKAWGALIRLQVQQGELRAAQVSLERAGRGGLTESALHAHQALVLAACGDRQAAEDALALVRPEAEAADPTLAEVVRATRQMLARRP